MLVGLVARTPILYAVGVLCYDRMKMINRMRDEVGNAGIDSLFGAYSDSRLLILRIL
jgi:hypothetical protein